mmetsp:Transcript_6090/g.19876  ORF Transcript_6090/g.19876 Transcript_6090/m.19876 type:complete len:272 (+) Transcript_6090:1338-2153(+)
MTGCSGVRMDRTTMVASYSNRPSTVAARSTHVPGVTPRTATVQPAAEAAMRPPQVPTKLTSAHDVKGLPFSSRSTPTRRTSPPTGTSVSPFRLRKAGLPTSTRTRAQSLTSSSHTSTAAAPVRPCTARQLSSATRTTSSPSSTRMRVPMQVGAASATRRTIAGCCGVGLAKKRTGSVTSCEPPDAPPSVAYTRPPDTTSDERVNEAPSTERSASAGSTVHLTRRLAGSESGRSGTGEVDAWPRTSQTNKPPTANRSADWHSTEADSTRSTM